MTEITAESVARIDRLVEENRRLKILANKERARANKLQSAVAEFKYSDGEDREEVLLRAAGINEDYME